MQNFSFYVLLLNNQLALIQSHSELLFLYNGCLFLLHSHSNFNCVYLLMNYIFMTNNIFTSKFNKKLKLQALFEFFKIVLMDIFVIMSTEILM